MAKTTLAPSLLLLFLASLAGAETLVVRGPSTLLYPDFWHTPLGIHRGTPKLLKFFLGERTQFDDPQGLACTRMRENGVESPQLTVFGVNTGRSQVIYNPDMTSLDVFGGEGEGLGQFRKPLAVAAMSDGKVAVADTGNHRVVILKYRNKKLAWDRVLGGPGTEKGEFSNPSGIALDSQGRLYVSDTGNNRVQVFSENDEFLFSFGDNAKWLNNLIEPQSLAVVDPLEPYSDKPTGALFVVDQYHGRIQKFDLSGRFLAQASGEDMGKVLVYFSGMALDYYNNAWVVDRGNHQIHKFDRHLQWVDSWGGKGEGDYRMDSPRGLSIYRHYGQVFLSERDSAQYLWIGSDIKDIKVSRGQNKDGSAAMRLDYRLTEGARVDCWIVEADEKENRPRIATLFKNKRLEQGPHTWLWHGITDFGMKIRPGVYFVVFQAEATYSSATYFRKEARKKFWVK